MGEEDFLEFKKEINELLNLLIVKQINKVIIGEESKSKKIKKLLYELSYNALSTLNLRNSVPYHTKTNLNAFLNHFKILLTGLNLEDPKST